MATRSAGEQRVKGNSAGEGLQISHRFDFADDANAFLFGLMRPQTTGFELGKHFWQRVIDDRKT